MNTRYELINYWFHNIHSKIFNASSGREQINNKIVGRSCDRGSRTKSLALYLHEVHIPIGCYCKPDTSHTEKNDELLIDNLKSLFNFFYYLESYYKMIDPQLYFQSPGKIICFNLIVYIHSPVVIQGQIKACFELQCIQILSRNN